MDARLDPECLGARELAAKQYQQTIVLTGGIEGQLATIVRNTHDRQITAHVGGCARCSSYKTAFCPECRFDLRKDPHGWRCPKGPLAWTDYLPWNWRAKTAPERETLSIPVRDASAAKGGPRGTVAPEPPRARPVPHRRAVSPPAAKPAPSPLAAAYGTLGITSAATPEQVRKAFRERALQYHPDKVAHMAPEFRAVAEQKMKELNDAYEKIKRAT